MKIGYLNSKGTGYKFVPVISQDGDTLHLKETKKSLHFGNVQLFEHEYKESLTRLESLTVTPNMYGGLKPLIKIV